MVSSETLSHVRRKNWAAFDLVGDESSRRVRKPVGYTTSHLGTIGHARGRFSARQAASASADVATASPTSASISWACAPWYRIAVRLSGSEVQEFG